MILRLLSIIVPWGLPLQGADPETPLAIDTSSISINADKSVRCQKDRRTCRAEGNVRVKKDAQEFNADTLNATFTEQNVLSAANAKGNVHFKTETFETHTPEANYDICNNELTAKGRGSRVKERLKDRELEATHIHVRFHPSHKKHPTQKEFKDVTAKTDVKFRTKTEYIRATTAHYSADEGKIEATGDVIVTRKEGCLQAPCVSGNLKSKSYVAGKPNPEGKETTPAPTDKVYGIFFSETKPKKTSP